MDGGPGDGSSRGSCPTGLNCHSDGSCSVCSSTAGGLAGTDAEPHSGCTSLNPSCNAAGTECQCDTATSLVCDASIATVCTAGVCMCGADPACEGITPTCDMTANPAVCIGCTDNAGGSGDGASQGSCSTESLMCLADGSCQCQLDMAGGGPGDAMSAGTCIDQGLLCLPDGNCKCQIDNAGGGDGDGTTQGTCAMGDACNADGSCSACNVQGNPGMERCKERAKTATNVRLWEHAYAAKMIQILREIVWMREHVSLLGSFAHQRASVHA